MKRLAGLTVGALVWASLMAAAHAAPAHKGSAPPGLKNAKKAMLVKTQHDKKVLAAKKQGIAVRKQSLTKKGALQ